MDRVDGGLDAAYPLGARRRLARLSRHGALGLRTVIFGPPERLAALQEQLRARGDRSTALVGYAWVEEGKRQAI